MRFYQVLKQEFVSLLLIIGVVLYPLFFLFHGLDFTDQGYWITNYNLIFSHPESVSQGFICYLSEIIGGFFVFVFAKNGLLSVRIGYYLVILLTAFFVFKILKDFFSSEKVLFALFLTLVFITKKNTPWIGYNNLTALFYVLVCFFVYKSVRIEKEIYFFLGGFFQTLSIFIRIPNILGIFLLIIPFFFLPSNKIKKYLFFSFFGGVSGLCFIGGIMLIFGHFTLFIESIVNLLHMVSDSNATHSGSNLVTLFIKDHVSTLKLGLFFIFAYFIILSISVVFFFLKNTFMSFIIAVGSSLGFWLFYFPEENLIKEIITFSRFEFTGIFYILGVIYFLYFLRHYKKMKLLVLMAGLLVLLLAPLGSDQGISNSVYGSWVIMPFLICLFFNLKRIGFKKVNFNKNSIQITNFFVCSIIFLYSSNICWGHVYRDLDDRMQLASVVKHKKLKLIYTNKKRARVVEEFLTEISKYAKKGDRLLVFESIPLIYFLTDTTPFFNSSWPFLFSDSVFKQKFEDASSHAESLPVIVKTKSSARRHDWPEMVYKGLPGKEKFYSKRKVLNDFAYKNRYGMIWENDFFEIWLPETISKDNVINLYQTFYTLDDYFKKYKNLKELHYNFKLPEVKVPMEVRPFFYGSKIFKLKGLRGNFSVETFNLKNDNFVKFSVGDHFEPNSKLVAALKFDFDQISFDEKEFFVLVVKAEKSAGDNFDIFLQENLVSWKRFSTENIFKGQGLKEYVVGGFFKKNSKKFLGFLYKPSGEKSFLKIYDIKVYHALIKRNLSMNE